MKITFKHRADYYFWAFAMVVIIKGFIGYLIDNDNIVVNIGDTYYVAYSIHAALFNALVLGIIGLMYYILYAYHVPLIKKLTKQHTAASMMVFIIAWIALPLIRRLQPESIFSYSWYHDENLVLLLLITAFVAVQFLLLINAAIGIAKKLRAGN